MENNKICPRCNREVDGNSKFCCYCGGSLMATVVIEQHVLEPGTVLHDRYQIEKAIGEGNFGITYLAVDNTLQMKVAVKEYYPRGFVTRDVNISAEMQIYSGDKSDRIVKMRDDFINEARTLAKMSGLPGIVDVRDYFQENNTAYIVMGYLDGEELGAYIEKNGYTGPNDAALGLGKRLTVDETKRIMQPVILALEKVHQQEMVHRDISPDNMKFASDGHLCIFDFGAAREADPLGTTEKTIMLKVGYAPEEQHRKKGKIGAWTDVYALCATMYKCITGMIPTDSIERAYQDTLKKPSELGIAISPLDEAALMMGLAVRIDDRFKDMNALYRALYRDGQSASGTQNPQLQQALTQGTLGGVNTFQTIAPQAATIAPMLQNKEKKNSKNMIMIAGIAVAVIVLGVIGVLALRKPETNDSNSDEQHLEKVEEVSDSEMTAVSETEEAVDQQSDTITEEELARLNVIYETVQGYTFYGEFADSLDEVCTIIGSHKDASDAKILLNQITSLYYEKVNEHYNNMFAQKKTPECFLEIQNTLDDAMSYFNQLRSMGYEVVDYSSMNSLCENYIADYKQAWATEFDAVADDSINNSANHIISRGIIWDSISRVKEVDAFTKDLGNAQDPLGIRYRVGLTLYVDSSTDNISAESAANIIKEYMKETGFNPYMVWMLAVKGEDPNAKIWVDGIDSILNKYQVYETGSFSSLDVGSKRNYIYYLMNNATALAEVQGYMRENYVY